MQLFDIKFSSSNMTSHLWKISKSTTVYPKKYAHGFCFAVLCCGYTLTDFPISIRLTSLALWQSNDCPSASKATLMNMDKYFIWMHYARLHNHNKAKHNKTMCIFLGIYCMLFMMADVLVLTSQCKCMRAFSKSYIAMHHNAGAGDFSANQMLRYICCLMMKAI